MLYEISCDGWLGVIPTFEKEQTVLDAGAKLDRTLEGGDLVLSKRWISGVGPKPRPFGCRWRGGHPANSLFVCGVGTWSGPGVLFSIVGRVHQCDLPLALLVSNVFCQAASFSLFYDVKISDVQNRLWIALALLILMCMS